jgi:Tfp pilus assembly PilM family ATPase
MSRVGVMSWDWKEDIDFDQLDRLVANLSNCRVRVFAVDTESDQIAIVVAAGDEQEVAEVDCQAVYEHWSATRYRADIIQWPITDGSSGSSSGGAR